MSRFSPSARSGSGQIGAIVGGNRSSRPTRKARASALRRRAPLWIGAALAGVLAIAWIDGGEEPIHPIVEPVALTEGGQ